MFIACSLELLSSMCMVQEEGQEQSFAEEVEAEDLQAFDDIQKEQNEKFEKTQASLMDYFSMSTMPEPDEICDVPEEYLKSTEEELQLPDALGLGDMQESFACNDEMVLKMEMLYMEEEYEAQDFAAPTDDRELLVAKMHKA